MTIKLVSLAVAVVLSIGCLWGIVHARTPWSQVAGNPVSFFVGFDADVVPADQQPLYQNMANVLNGFTEVHDARSNFYSAVINNNGFVVNRWSGVIESVEPNANGNLVTLLVSAGLSSDATGPATFMAPTGYLEQYQVNNDGTFQYVQSLDPKGLAGQLPYMPVSL